MSASFRSTVVLFAMAVATLCNSATAVVTELSAEIRSSIETIVDGSVESSDTAIENFGDTGLSLPIETIANLESRDGDDNVNGGAIALAEFRDPADAGPQRNPGEIGIEADCFSDDPDTQFVATSSVVERRVVSLSAEELGNPESGAQSVRSSVFISGAIFAWSLDENVDLSGLSGDVTITVRRILLDEAGEETTSAMLVEETVALVGNADGTISLANDSSLFVFDGDISILPDADTSQLGLPDVNLDALAVAQVAVIIAQDVDYQYRATVDQPFVLEATFETRVANVPGGTGVVATFGRTFEQVADILALGIPEQSAKNLESRLNRAIDEFKENDPPRATIQSPAACGLFGVEMMPFALLPAVFFSSLRRGKPRR
jgi:hypothetical protein